MVVLYTPPAEGPRRRDALLKVNTAAQFDVPRLRTFGQAAHEPRTGGGNVCAREGEIGVIERVREGGREREFESFGDGERLGNGSVLHIVSGAFEEIDAGVTVSSGGRHC